MTPRALAPATLLLALAACRCAPKPAETPAPAPAPVAQAPVAQAQPSVLAPTPDVVVEDAVTAGVALEKGGCGKGVPKAKGARGVVDEAGQMPDVRTGAAALSDGTDLWVVGGQTSRGYRTDKVSVARLGPDGKPSRWLDAGTLPEKRMGPGVALHERTLLVFGGETGHADGGKDASQDVFVGRPDAEGRIASFTRGPSLPSPRVRMAAAAGKRVVYLVGGKANRVAPADNTVILARLDARGDVVSYERGRPLPEARERASAVVANGRLYVVGGNFAGNDKPCAESTVMYAPIGPGGVLGAWKWTTSLPAMPAGAALAASGGVLYLVGGVTDYGDRVGSEPVGSVLCARAGGDGTLSPWRRAAHLKDLRYGHAAVVAGGRLYALGGFMNELDVLGDVFSLPLDGPAGACSP